MSVNFSNIDFIVVTLLKKDYLFKKISIIKNCIIVQRKAECFSEINYFMKSNDDENYFFSAMNVKLNNNLLHYKNVFLLFG